MLRDDEWTASLVISLGCPDSPHANMPVPHAASLFPGLSLRPDHESSPHPWGQAKRPAEVSGYFISVGIFRDVCQTRCSSEAKGKLVAS